MKLISELTESVEYLVESSNGKKSYYIEGIFMQADTPNRNGRIYPRGIMENALNKYQSDYISSKRAMGELGHPQGPQINLDRVSHVIENLNFKSNTDVVGRAKILDTPMGKIAQNLIDEGIKLGVSSRGLGSLKQLDNGVKQVQEDFFLSTVDIVADPSAPSAWVNGIMESVDYEMLEDGRIIQAIVDKRKGRLNEESFMKALQSTLNESVHFMTSNFELSHGRKPAGRGSWFFSKHSHINFDKHKEGDDYVSFNNKTYSEARNKAKEWAKSKGHSIIHVMP